MSQYTKRLRPGRSNEVLLRYGVDKVLGYFIDVETPSKVTCFSSTVIDLGSVDDKPTTYRQLPTTQFAQILRAIGEVAKADTVMLDLAF